MSTPFLRGKTWWARVPQPGALGVQRSLGTQDHKVAQHIARFLDHLKATNGLKESWLLLEMAEGRVPVWEAYHAYAGRQLDAFVEGKRFGKDDPPLEPYLPRWVAEMERRRKPGAHTRHKYESQVRTLVRDGFRRSELTRPTIRAWLQALPVGQPNRYRAALSSFCTFLLLEEVLDFNPVAGVPASEEHPARDRHLRPDQALRLVMSMPSAEDRAFQALLLCTAADVDSARQLVAEDIEGPRVRIRGTKQAWRDRYCYIYKRWDPVWKVFADWFIRLPIRAETPVFQNLGRYDQIRRRFMRACAAEGIEDYTMKDHRHTWAVQAFKDGLPIHAIYQQLGHRDATMALKVYGKHKVRAADYGLIEEAS